MPAPRHPWRRTPALSSRAERLVLGSVTDEPAASSTCTLSAVAETSVPTSRPVAGAVTRTRDPGARPTDAPCVVDWDTARCDVPASAPARMGSQTIVRIISPITSGPPDLRTSGPPDLRTSGPPDLRTPAQCGVMLPGVR